jgi:hypothetical protein
MSAEHRNMPTARLGRSEVPDNKAAPIHRTYRRSRRPGMLQLVQGTNPRRLCRNCYCPV